MVIIWYYNMVAIFFSQCRDGDKEERKTNDNGDNKGTIGMYVYRYTYILPIG